MVSCPSCHSRHIWKDGLRYIGEDEIQRYLCRDCGHRFSETTPRRNSHTRRDLDPGLLYDPTRLQIETAFNGSGLSDHVETIHRASLKRQLNIPLDRQICAFKPTGAKNLAKVTSRIEKRAAGATKDIQGKIVEWLWHLKKKGLAEITLYGYGHRIRNIAAKCNLLDPEDVKGFIAKQKRWSERTKAIAVTIYNEFAKWIGLEWEPPIYKPVRKIPFIPMEEELDQLIAAAGPKLAKFLQLLKETGMREGEALRLKWSDLDFKRKIVEVNSPEKGSNPRILPISDKLIGMLQRFPKKSESLQLLNVRQLLHTKEEDR